MKYSRHSNKSNQQKRLLFVCIAVAILLVAPSWFFIERRAHSPFPADVTKKVSFVVYYPDKTWQINGAKATYANGALFFVATKEDVTVSFNEQATPQVFNDVSQYYPTLLTRLKEYASFGTANGMVNLTRPAELNGGQTAVLNNDGTLVFVRPNHDLDVDQWRQLFNRLQTIK